MCHLIPPGPTRRRLQVVSAAVSPSRVVLLVAPPREEVEGGGVDCLRLILAVRGGGLIGLGLAPSALDGEPCHNFHSCSAAGAYRPPDICVLLPLHGAIYYYSGWSFI